jgi:hypothetical protein
MHQLQRSWVWSKHPSAQWNLRGGRWSSAEYCTEKNREKIPQKNIWQKKNLLVEPLTIPQRERKTKRQGRDVWRDGGFQRQQKTCLVFFLFLFHHPRGRRNSWFTFGTMLRTFLCLWFINNQEFWFKKCCNTFNFLYIATIFISQRCSAFIYDCSIFLCIKRTLIQDQ